MNTVVTRIKMMIARLYTMLYSVHHPIEKKILFLNYGGQQYSDNPRAITEMMHIVDPSFELVWKINDTKDPYSIIPKYVIRKALRGLDLYKEIATSYCVVNSECFEPNIYKRKRQLFIQTWHGDRGFKYVLYDAWNNKKRPIPVTDNSVTDYCIAASDYGEETYRSAFKYKGKILKIGSPRNDKLLNCTAEERENIKGKLGIDSERKVLLFAPTYRDNNSDKQTVIVDLLKVVEQLEKRTKAKWICLLRAHTASSGLNFPNHEDFVDVTSYPDMTDLLCITDFLLTDYSSSACDISITKTPVVLTIFDYKAYQKECRQFRVDPKSVGFYYAENQKELDSIIERASDEDFALSNTKANAFYNTIETGNASKNVCCIITERYYSRNSNA